MLIAHRNEPGQRDPRGLSAREARVAAYAALGHDAAEIAYLLGISAATVATHLRSVQRKLGLASRSDLVECFEASA